MITRFQSAVFSVAVLAGSFAATAPALAESASAGNTSSVSCLTAPARALIGSIVAKFGPMDIISTCRPGARVAGTGQISRHSSGNAIDFIAGNRKPAVLAWLIANHSNGGTMTYSNSPHIHVDIGPHWVQLAGGYSFTGGDQVDPAAKTQKVHYRRHKVQPVQN